jgi:hypothetical protein
MQETSCKPAPQPTLYVSILLVAFLAPALTFAQAPAATRGFQAGVSDPELRMTPASFSREQKRIVVAEAFRNEVVSLQFAARGQKSITTSILHDPWRSQTGLVFPSMVEWRYPGQWQPGQGSKLRFDYSAFDRYVVLMVKAGVRRSIHRFSPLNGPGHTPDCNIGYVDTTTGQLRIRHTAVGGPRLKIHQLLAETKGKPMNESNPYTSNVQIRAKFSPEDFVPDGDLSKQVWQEAERVRFEHDMSGRRTFPQSETQVASFWTPTQVYFAFWCKYTTLNVYEGEDIANERWELWNRDVVEVFLNPQPERVNHYYEFEVAPNNQWIDLEIDKDKEPFNDAGWNSGFQHATRIDAENHLWTCEMRIPVSALNVRVLDPETEWRVNFYRADGPGGNSQRRFMPWSTIPQGRTFHVSTRFGIICFVK